MLVLPPLKTLPIPQNTNGIIIIPTITPAIFEFEKLLNNQISKTKNLTEGKIIEGKITKITDKYVFLFIPGLKSEPVIDVNEAKMIGIGDEIKEGTPWKRIRNRLQENYIK